MLKLKPDLPSNLRKIRIEGKLVRFGRIWTCHSNEVTVVL